MAAEIRRNAIDMCYDRYLPGVQRPAKTSNEERLVLIESKMWVPGDRLSVSFIGGSAIQKQHVLDAAARLMEAANIEFVFLSSGAGTIRIAFNPSLGAWSMIGKDCLGVPRTQPTINLGFDQPGTYTHELCHALGAIHEHQSPFGNPIKWNKPQVYHDLGGPPNNWDAATIDHNMFETYSQTQTNGTTFDPKSIMLYAFPASWTIDGFHSDPNAVLSDLDKQWLRTKYPGRTPPADPPTEPPPVVVTPPVPPQPGASMPHMYTFDMVDVRNVMASSTPVGIRLNSGTWLAGYAAQVAMPPTVTVPGSGQAKLLADGEAEMNRLLLGNTGVQSYGGNASNAMFGADWLAILTFLLDLLAKIKSGVA